MNNVLAELKEKLEDALKADVIRKFYQGEVLLVPQSYLPALMVFGNSTTVVAKSTACDQFVYDITIRIIFDIKKVFSENGTKETLQAPELMAEIMEGKQNDGTLRADSVLGVLRKVSNVRGTNFLFNNDIKIDYKTIQKGEFFYFQADCNLTATSDLIKRNS